MYWTPISHVLCAVVEVLVGHPQEMQQRPGKQTDEADARWIAALLAHGLIRPSCIPPPPMRALRDLTRSRGGLVQSRSQATNRVDQMLEDTNICLLASVRAESLLRHAPPGLPAFFCQPSAVYMRPRGRAHSHTVFCTPHRHKEGWR